jgi:hypothetical protein
LFDKWKYGLFRLERKDIHKLGFPNGLLLEVTPGESSLRSMEDMQRVLYMMQRYPARFSFEIWKDDKFSFHFFSSSPNVEGMIKAQLKTIYPQTEVKRARKAVPNFREGDYISAGHIVMSGLELNFRRPEEFHFDPLRHILEAMNQHDGVSMVQIIFEKLRKIPKKKKIVLAQKYSEGKGISPPLLRCVIRIVTSSSNGKASRESCEHISHTFSAFDSEKCRLFPKLVSFPLLKNSFGILCDVSDRTFPLFGKEFMISIPELSSMVHIPVGAGSSGVPYNNPSLQPNW